MRKFDSVAHKIQYVDHGVAVHAFKGGFFPGPFKDKIISHKPKSIEAIRKMSEGFIRIQEYNNPHYAEPPVDEGNPKKDKKKKKRGGGGGPSREEDRSYSG